jgi:diacylglycerol kinase family enzyme
MSTNRKIAFVINPNAGVKKKIDIIQFIKANFDSSIQHDYIVWKNKDDFESVKLQILSGNYTCAVACGGDGTVNQVASCILDTNIALGILPLGSGNGLARTNGIKINLHKALKQIEQGKTKSIDAASINNIPYFCTAGIGFDALIANLFASNKTRGFYLMLLQV